MATNSGDVTVKSGNYESYLHIPYTFTSNESERTWSLSTQLKLKLKSGWTFGAWKHVGTNSANLQANGLAKMTGGDNVLDSWSTSGNYNDNGTAPSVNVSWAFNVNSSWGGYANSPHGSVTLTGHAIGANAVWNDINALNPAGTQDGASAYFDLYTSENNSWRYGLTNEDTDMTHKKGTYFQVQNIRPFYNYYELDYVEGHDSEPSPGVYKKTFDTANEVLSIHMRYKSFNLIINPNGGSYGGTTSNTTITKKFNETYTLGYPTRDNYIFSHWTASRVANFDSQGVGFNVYNNNGNGTVTHTWLQSESTSGTNCDVCKIVTNGSASPGAGGFYQGFQTQPSHTYYQIYRLKVPTGYTVSYANNAMGDNPVVTSLTSMAGTGDWKTYIFKLQTSSSGDFSSSGFIYLNGSNNTSVTWYLASAQVWDATDGVYRANVNGVYRYDYSASDCTLTANWKQLNYYLDVNWTLDGTSVSNALSSGYASADVYINGSKVSTGIGDYYVAHPYGTTYKVVATAKTGYQFSNGSTTQTIEGTIGEANANAQFAIQTKSYTVAYNANGGTSTPTTQTAKYKAAITLASAIKKNNTDANVTITVTYNANGGSGAPGNSTGTAVNTTPYTFSKWALNSTSGTQYAAGASYTIPAANSTMYAIWTTGTTTRKSNPSITLSSTKPIRSGYNFKGWSTSNTATTASHNAGTAYTFSANTTLYAVWELAQAQLYTKTIIPSTYQAVEYIESTGTQYIDTGAQVFSGTNHKIELDFSPTSFYDYNSLWGCTTDADTWEGWIYSTGQLASRYNGNRYGDDNAITVNTRYKYVVQKEGATLSKTLNGTVIGTGTAVDKTTTGSLTLFLSGSDYGKYKIYGCRLWGNGGIVRDLRPCYRKSDNAIGLYDTISGTFYTNSGTGTFTKGSNVSGHWSYGPAYVKVDGAWKVAKQVYTKVNGAWVLNK